MASFTNDYLIEILPYRWLIDTIAVIEAGYKLNHTLSVQVSKSRFHSIINSSSAKANTNFDLNKSRKKTSAREREREDEEEQ